MSDAVAARRAQKDQLLESALMHAAFDGWSRRTLVNAASDIGVDAATARRLFPQGGDSLVVWLDDWTDRKMLEAASKEDLARLSMRRRIAWLVRTRLEILSPYRESLRRAALAQMLPQNAAQAGRSLWTTVDRIWQAAGVTAGREEGLSYFTRRGLLAGVLLSTFLYWLEDQSDGFADSWAFLDRRIEDALRLGKAGSQVTNAISGLPGMGFVRKPA